MRLGLGLSIASVCASGVVAAPTIDTQLKAAAANIQSLHMAHLGVTVATGNIIYTGANQAYGVFNSVSNVTPGASCIAGTIEEVNFWNVYVNEFDMLEYVHQILGIAAAG